VIVALGGARVGDVDDLQRLLGESAIGASASLVLLRLTEKRELAVAPVES
jgi:S1-C subfamily serine protease